MECFLEKEVNNPKFPKLTDSDMHCMSDVYLADELEHEYADKGMGNRR